MDRKKKGVKHRARKKAKSRYKKNFKAGNESPAGMKLVRTRKYLQRKGGVKTYKKKKQSGGERS